MKGRRYHELLSKIDTDASTDEKILEKLRSYQPDGESLQPKSSVTKDDKINNIYELKRRASRQRYHFLRQALPSLAFLILILVSVYGLATGVYRDIRDRNSELSVASETANEASDSLTDEVTDSANSRDTSDIAESEAITTAPEADVTTTGDIEVTDNALPGASESSLPEASDSLESDASDNKATDTSDDEHYVVTDHGAEAVNICSDYYKNDTFSEDLKILLRFNDASKVESLFIQSLGNVDSTNYTVEGNMITLQKEYLDTLPEGLYKLDINMDKGNPAFAQFAVHPEEEISEFGYYRLSHYYWDYYLSDPKDFTFLVSNRMDARITGLRNGSIEIDPEYYELDENGYVATLYQSYMAGMQEGVHFDLVIKFNDGTEKTIEVRIRERELISPTLNPNYNVFEKSSPEDVKFQIIWNDAKYIASIDPETYYSVRLSSDDYVLENDTLIIKKEFLETLPAGEYTWGILFDIEIGMDFKIRVND